MIRYILVDDNPKILKRVKAKIDTLSKDYQLKHLKSYSSSKEAYEAIQDSDYDLLIVDFEMPVYNGIELAQKIATNNKIIFLTSTINNEKQVINNLDISGYLSKPFDLEEFVVILKKKIIGRIKTISTRSKRSFINLQIGTNKDVRFSPSQIYYISTSRNYNGDQPLKNNVHIYGKDDKILFKNVRITINELYQELEDDNFEKISQSTIINMSHIKERDNTNLSLFDTRENFEITAKEKSSFVSKLRVMLKL